MPRRPLVSCGAVMSWEVIQNDLKCIVRKYSLSEWLDKFRETKIVISPYVSIFFRSWLQFHVNKYQAKSLR